MLTSPYHGFTDSYTMVNGSFGVKWAQGKVTTLVRGEVVAEAGEFVGAAGSGRFLRCDISPATVPLGRRTIAFDPATGSAEPSKHGDQALINRS